MSEFAWAMLPYFVLPGASLAFLPRWWKLAAVWNAWAGAIPGAVVGCLVGLAIDLVWFDILGHSWLNGFAVKGWIVGILAGGLASGHGFFAYGMVAEASSEDRRTTTVFESLNVGERRTMKSSSHERGLVPSCKVKCLCR